MKLNVNEIDKTIPVPLYFQLKELLLTELKSGDYPEGYMIPTELEISAMFKLSRTTVRQAIQQLVSEGWLYRIKSKGTFITTPKRHQDFVTQIESFESQAMRRNQSPSTAVLEFRRVKATEEVAAALELKKDDLVIYLHRKRSIDGEAVFTVKTYLPASLCKFLLEEDLSQVSLYSELNKSEQTHVVQLQRKIEAVAAGKEDENYLGLVRGEPILAVTSVGCNAMKKPIEYSLTRFRGDKNFFNVTAELK